MQETRYTTEYFDRFQEGARRSARVIVPIVQELVQPTSVCDVGCARGTWLSVFLEHGVGDVYGLDGEHLRTDELEIPVDRFAPVNLEERFALDRTFDLAICLEVAEHLPESSAAGLVDSLVRLAPVVLFSAAIPFQGGAGHVNEQWPEYWEEHFKRAGHVTIDCLRPRIWSRPGVLFWYAQNMLLFVERSCLESRPELKREYENSESRQLSIVHPALLEHMSKWPWKFLKELMRSRDDGETSAEEFEAKLAKMIARRS